MASEETRIVFGQVEVDLDRFVITNEGHEVKVEPQVFDVLRHLILHRNRLVTKEELLDEIWGDRFVSQSALATRIKSARQAVGDDGRRQAVIRTVHGRGYQFVAPVDDDQADQSRAPRRPAIGSGPHWSRHRPETPILGRDDLMEDLARRLDAGRLLSLVGPGGVGKTHLALHTAARIGDRFPAGVWLAELANVREAEAVGQAVLDAIGGQRTAEQDQAAAVVAGLSERTGLLILDNCEHVLGAAAELADAVLAEAPDVAVLATSRVPLAVTGEHLVPVPLLGLDAAVELLAHRLQENGVVVDPAAKVVAELCRSFDRLPLALVLASAQARWLGLEELLALADQRLALLRSTTGPVAHQQALEDTIAWSWDAISSPAQETLARFSQFAGLFDLAAAVAVANAGTERVAIDAVRPVTELAQASLLTVEQQGDKTHYRLLESVRLFAQERLTADDRRIARLAHLDHYVDAASDRCQLLRLQSTSDEQWPQFAQEWGNYRTAIDTAVELDRLDQAIELLLATLQFAVVTQRFEHGDWSRRIIESLETAGRTPPRDLLGAQAQIVAFQGDFAASRQLADQAWPGQPSLPTAGARFWTGYVTGDGAAVTEALAALDQLTRGQGGVEELTTIAMATSAASDYGIDPGDAAERARRIAATGGPISRATLAMIEAFQALEAGELGAVLHHTDEQLAGARALDLRLLASTAMVVRSAALSSAGHSAQAGAAVRELLAVARSRQHWGRVRSSTAHLAAAALAEHGRHEAAARVLAASQLDPADQASLQLAASLRAELGPRYGPITEQARLMTAAELADYAIDQLDEVLDR